MHKYYNFREPSEQTIIALTNEYVRYGLENEPLISITIFERIQEIRELLQTSFETVYKHNRIWDNKHIPGEMKHQSFDDFMKAGNIFKPDSPFTLLIKSIVTEIRRELKTDK